jgi:hypothetical protein
MNRDQRAQFVCEIPQILRKSLQPPVSFVFLFCFVLFAIYNERATKGLLTLAGPD